MTEPHLWEIDHPYYATTGNYFASGDSLHDVHTELSSWRSFTQTIFYSGDRSLNLLYRWDWYSPTRHPDPDLRGSGVDYLSLYFMLQRKACACSVSIRVNDEDEPDVRAWLAECAQEITAIWEPIQLTSEGATDAE